jgi:hypothetical protein
MERSSFGPRLSKSKFVLGLQCPKALYFEVHRPELKAPVSSTLQLIFDQGQEVGELARQNFPEGRLITASHRELELALEQTRRAITDGALVIFEGAIEAEGLLVRVDLLIRSAVDQPWRIIEVKSSTHVKEVHRQDAALQFWVLKKCGLEIEDVYVQVIQSDCEFPDLSKFFKQECVTPHVHSLYEKIPDWLKDFQGQLAASVPPQHDIGPHCHEPYECAYKKHCWGEKNLPHPAVFNVPRLKSEQQWEFYRRGCIALDQIDLSQLNDLQQRMVTCTLEDRRFVNRDSIQHEIQGWQYPLSFLDFETMAYAIPRFAGTKPYEQVPFQFSCLVQAAASGELMATEYLHMDSSDPRRPLAVALTESVPPKGSVVAYHASFEKGVIQALAKHFPDLSEKLESIAQRLVDPLPIIRAHVYDPKFVGSFSIKSTAPALLGPTASYKNLKIPDGGQAQVAFVELSNPTTNLLRKDELAKALREYCHKDTLVMAELVFWLQEQ